MWRITAAFGRTILLACLCAAGGGCTIIHIHESDGTAAVVRRWGVVSIEPGTGIALVTVSSLGVQNTFGSLSVGWSRAQAALVNARDCQVIFWVANDSPVREVADLIGNQSGLCAAQ